MVSWTCYFIFWSNFYTRFGAWTYNPKMQGHILYQLSQPDTLISLFSCRSLEFYSQIALRTKRNITATVINHLYTKGRQDRVCNITFLDRKNLIIKPQVLELPWDKIHCDITWQPPLFHQYFSQRCMKEILLIIKITISQELYIN